MRDSECRAWEIQNCFGQESGGTSSSGWMLALAGTGFLDCDGVKFTCNHPPTAAPHRHAAVGNLEW